MFQSAIRDACDSIVNLNRLLRASRQMQVAMANPRIARETPDRILRSGSMFPSSSTIREFEHSSVILQLYAAYESCVSSLVGLWLRELPNMVDRYSDLGSSFQEIHRVGISNVLAKIKHQRFSHLSAEIVSLGFSECIADHKSYEVLPEAFIGENRTLKKDRLCELLSHLRVDLGWDGVVAHNSVTNVLRDDYGETENAESVLKDFISYRNDAAHGRPSQILGYSELMRVLRFVDSVCNALADVFARSRAKLLITEGKTEEIGSVTEVFAKPKAVVIKADKGRFAIGNELFFRNESKTLVGYIDELKLDEKHIKYIELTKSTELGLKLDVLPKKNMKVLRLKTE